MHSGLANLETFSSEETQHPHLRTMQVDVTKDPPPSPNPHPSLTPDRQLPVIDPTYQTGQSKVPPSLRYRLRHYRAARRLNGVLCDLHRTLLCVTCAINHQQTQQLIAICSLEMIKYIILPF